jgi:DNA-binding LacI/PurR family transcriptional regulator
MAGCTDALTAAVLDRDPGLTAIVAMTDQLALGALDALRERGAAVPGAISVVGFDDVPDAATSDPPLTTVRQPLLRKGEEAGRLLVAPPAQPAEVLLPVELVVRGSTGPPPSRAPSR